MQKNFLTLLSLSLLVAACQPAVNKVAPSSLQSEAMNKAEVQQLESLVKSEIKVSHHQSDDQKIEGSDFISLVSSELFDSVKAEIEASGGKILFADSKTGMISFRSKASVAQALMVENKVNHLTFDQRQVSSIPKFDSSKLSQDGQLAMPKNFYPTQMMAVDKLKEELKAEGIEVDGSSSTIAIFDTGLDIARTDIFQDRIVELHTIRETDFAKMTDAQVVEENGINYLVASIDGVSLKIEKTGVLATEREYLIGYFSEKQFGLLGYENFDLNQDGQDNAIFPVVAFKNEQGLYNVYVNTNSTLTYGAAGDDSIADENLLLDFNYVSKNIADRYVDNKQSPVRSYYRYTTRLDVAKIAANRPIQFVKERNKGLVNLAVLVRPNFELDAQGNLIAVNKQDELPLYHIGLAGFDVGHHGTHCAGIAAGDFKGAAQFSSGASKAKIVGGSLLGTGYTYNDYFKMIQTVAENNKNVVFSFSFGSNTAINLLGGKTASFIDAIAKAYGVAFVKAAGNEGPGINSHGNGTSQWTLDVANYYSSNSRNSHGTDGEYLGDDKVFVSPSSSRGPMYEGALKPDIGAPGYVMSAVPMSIDMGSKAQVGFGYWPGTSMATPNAASVVALLYDAAVKTGLTDETSVINPFSVDKLRKAIKNSATAYDVMTTAECRNTFTDKGGCELIKKDYKFSWIEGGAGRINALGAWNVLKKIIDEKPMFISTKTPSRLDNYEGYNIGFYAHDEVPASATFWVELNTNSTMEDLSTIHSYRLASDVDWMYFDANLTKKEKVIEIVPGTKPYVEIYFDRAKLVKNGRLIGGVHAGLVKAFNLNGDTLVDWIFPVTLVGADSRFDQVVDSSAFSARGFIPAGQFARYFFKVEEKQSVLLLDLQTSMTSPGAVRMSVYKDGMEKDYKEYGTKAYWAASSNEYAASRQNTRYVLSNLTAGMYEVVVHADASASYDYQGVSGSFYELTANRLSLAIEGLELKKGSESSVLTARGVKADRYLKISKAGVIVNQLVKNEKVEVKHQDRFVQTIIIPESVEQLVITTDYLGSEAKTDVDMALVNELGQTVAQSGNQGSREVILMNGERGLKAGVYTLILEGYDIPQGSASIDLRVLLELNSVAVMSNSLTAAGLDKEIGANTYLKANKTYNFMASWAMSELASLPQLDGFQPIYTMIVSGAFGNNGEEVTLLKKDVE